MGKKLKEKSSKGDSQFGCESVAPPAVGQPMQELSLMGLLQWGSAELLKAARMAEVTAHLGYDPYERVPAGEKGEGERNGFRETTIDTPIGSLTYPRQRLVNAPSFQSAYHRPYMRRPEEFADTVCEMYVSGVSTRKVKKALVAVAGKKSKLSRSTVSRITKKLRDEFATWKKRDLSELPVAYLFLDAVYVGMRLEKTRKQAVLLAYAALEDGSFELVSIGIGHAESNSIWKNFVADLKQRGLSDPLLVISDGNHGLISAIDSCFPGAYRQRCVKHRTQNILDAVPKEKQAEVKAMLDRIFYGATSLEQAKAALWAFRKAYKHRYPSAVERLDTDIDQCLTYFLFPTNHWKRIRTSNCLERLNLEIRRRLNVIGRHPSEDGCLSLVYQISRRYAEGKASFKANDIVQALWKRLRQNKEEMIGQLDFFKKAA